MAANEIEFPAMKPKLWPLSKIQPYPNNPKMHPPEQVSMLARLFRQHGIDQPIVVDDEGVILKGHGRRLAAVEAGMASYPVIQHKDLTDTEKRAMRIQDNQISLLGTWDPTLIKFEIDLLKRAEFDVSLLGFGDVQLVSFEATPGPPAGDASRIGNLAERFGVVPFSTLNAREGWWQDRKRAWLALGIMSELGRGENLLKMSDTILEPDPKKREAMVAKRKVVPGRGGAKTYGAVGTDMMSKARAKFSDKKKAGAPS